MHGQRSPSAPRETSGATFLMMTLKPSPGSQEPVNRSDLAGKRACAALPGAYSAAICAFVSRTHCRTLHRQSPSGARAVR
jgi:hypothetical protein